jgi:hypothetical protein
MNDQLLQYEGFLNTDGLLIDNTLDGISKFELDVKDKVSEDLVSIPGNIVLGKRIEYLFESYVNESNRYELLAKNIQIIEDKITVGELDFILRDKVTDKKLHVELVYKFYLFVKAEDEISSWIGPNKNDSLLLKLDKLRLKQFPLLNRSITTSTINKLGINTEGMEQQICFLGNLFLPYEMSNEFISSVNSKCVVGWWMNLEDFKIALFQSFEFSIPNKKDWVLSPQEKEGEWLSYQAFLSEVELLHAREKSPLCWIKKPNGTLERFFLVWW